jgi:hypothetical protein
MNDRTHPSLSQQAEACRLAAHRVRQKKPIVMRDAERGEHARRLEAAASRLEALNNGR